MRRPNRSPLLTFIIPLVLILNACSQPAPEPTANGAGGVAAPRRATLGDLVGQVQGKRNAAEPLALVALGFMLESGGEAQTGDNSRARLDFDDDSIVRMAANSAFVLQDVQPQSDGRLLMRLQLTFGKLWVSLTGGEIQVETPVGVATVRGSFALFQYDPATQLLRLDCLEGQCAARNQAVNAQLGNLERIILGQQNSLRQTLIDADVQSFLQENPESGRLIAILTAAPPATATPNNATPTATVGPAASTPASIAPVAASSTATQALPLITLSPSLDVTIAGTHVVRGGETLNCIGRGYGVLPTAIAAVNAINASANLTVGQNLRIPAVQWTAITPGPVCTPQFQSPFPGLPATPTITTTATPSATPSVTPTSTPTIDAPVFSNLTPAQPLVVDTPNKCLVVFSADIAYSQGIVAAYVEWPLGTRPTLSPMSLTQGDRFSGTWSTEFFIFLPAGSTLNWRITATDPKQNSYNSAPGAPITTTTFACASS